MGKFQGSSSSQGGPGLAGSGAISHAYIQHPPLRCDVPGAAGVMYDDGNKLLLVPSPSKVFSWPVNKRPPPDSPNVTPIKEGPILGVRFSLDGGILAVQRTNREVEFVNRESCTGFRQQCKSGTERILGFFWTDCPTCDVVFITTSGLELYTLYLGRNGLKLVDVKKVNVSWYIYTHESRLVLLASGMQCKTLSGFQFAAGGIIKLPKFDVTMAKAESNRKPVLAPEDIRIATMYGRLYCLQVDRVALQLHMYRFYRDAVVPQGSLPIYSPQVAISVVDNVLLIHQTDSKVVLLYDILADPKVPISAPLPLLLRISPSLPGVSSRSTESANNPRSLAAERDYTGSLTNSEASIYGDGWVFVNPDLVLDHIHGLLWHIRLDLEAVAASSSDIPSLLGFLQRRRHEASKAKHLSLVLMRSMIMERRPLPLIATAMDVLTSCYSQGFRPPGVMGGPTFHHAQFSKPSAMQLAGGITLSAGPIVSVPASLTGTPGLQPAAMLSSLEVASAEPMAGAGREPSGDHREGPDAEVSSSDQVQSSGALGLEQDRTAGRDTQNSSDQGELENAGSVDGAFQGGLRKVPSVGEIAKGEVEIEESPSPMSQEPVFAERSGSRVGRSFTSSMEALTSSTPTHLGLRDSCGGVTLPLISPDDMQHSVFAPVEEEMAVDSRFLVSAIIEYMRSVASANVRVQPGLHVLVVQLLDRDERYHELHQFVAGKLLEPSKAVALQLLEVGARHTPTRKLGMEMLRLLHAHSEYVSLLLQEGRLVEGLRYIRQNKVDAIPPAMFLEAAAAVNDAQKLGAVFRFCLDFVPDFKNTADFTVYSSRLNQQCYVVGGQGW